MQVTVETLEGLERRLKVRVPAEQIDNETHKRLKEMAPKIKIDGFRPGKVPLSVVEKRYGPSVRGEVIGDVIRDTYESAIMQEHLNPVGDPQMKLTHAQTGKALEYEATLEVYPEIHLNNMQDAAIEQLQVEVGDQDVEIILEQLRKQQAQWNEQDRPAAKGDRVVVDFEGKMDGEAFEKGTAKDVTIELGAGMMIPGFEEAIIGEKPGAAIHVDLTFPSDYRVENLANKPVSFSINLHKVLEPNLPPLDDTFAQKIGLKEGNMEKVRAEVRENMEKDLKRTLKAHLKEQLLEKFLERNPIQLPKALVEREIHHLQHQAKQQFTAQTGKETAPDYPHEQFLELAETRVSLGLLFAEYIKLHEIKTDPEKVRAMIEDIASAYEYKEEIINWYYANKKQLAQVETLVLEEEVIEHLLKDAKVTTKTVSYKEAMQSSK